MYPIDWEEPMISVTNHSVCLGLRGFLRHETLSAKILRDHRQTRVGGHPTHEHC